MDWKFKLLLGVAGVFVVVELGKALMYVPIWKNIDIEQTAYVYNEDQEIISEVEVKIEGVWTTSLAETKFLGDIVIGDLEAGHKGVLGEHNELFLGDLSYIEIHNQLAYPESYGSFSASNHFEEFTFFIEDDNTIVTNKEVK